ncbi:hypothetical protein DFJ73DRAFT_757661 [Zopfochytrium polystomum]|nr:hypothetical protein DFJ73DRAFT_757661 [Zopfochytrium polystomum]
MFPFPSFLLVPNPLLLFRGRFSLVLAVVFCIAAGVAIGSMLAVVTVRPRTAAATAPEGSFRGRMGVATFRQANRDRVRSHHLLDVEQPVAAAVAVEPTTKPMGQISMLPSTNEAPPSTLTALQRSQLRPKPGAARIAYLNRHGGTQNNMNWIMTQFGLSVTQVNPFDLEIEYGMSKADADALRESGSLCAQYDIIIVGDTIPDARPLLQDLHQQTPACTSTHIILEITVRFDALVEDGDDYEEYLSMFRDLYERDERRLHVVANNPFEVYYAFRSGVRFRRWRVLRPGGVSDVAALDTVDSTVAAFRGVWPNLDELFTQFNIPVHSLDYHYGGPRTLAKYKAYIDSPYQVSTMKLYENLAAGVVMMVPSPGLWRELNLNGTQEYTLCWPDVEPLDLADYSRLIDFYHTDISPYIYYFDSFEALSAMLSAESGWTDGGSKNVRETGPAWTLAERERTLMGWQEVLFEAGALVL